MCNECFYGIEGIVFNWHGEWADPTVTYKGQEFNYWDVEDALFNMFMEDHPAAEQVYDDPSLDRDFREWISANPHEAYNLLDDWIALL